MHIGRIIAGGLLCAATGSSAASADYFLQIKGVARDAPAGPIYLQATSTGDLDGDGLADKAIVRLVCADGALRTVEYSIESPRDAASGQPTGKRMHKPVTFIKEWGPATPQLMAMKPTYDLKKLKGNERQTADAGGWTALSLANADGLCAAAEAAAGKVTKTRSNIQNN